MFLWKNRCQLFVYNLCKLDMGHVPRLSLIHHPLEIWGQCSTVTKDGKFVHTTGGWSDLYPGRDLTSTFGVPLTHQGIPGNWKRLADMNVGRATHACLATSYKVHTGLGLTMLYVHKG